MISFCPSHSTWSKCTFFLVFSHCFTSLLLSVPISAFHIHFGLLVFWYRVHFFPIRGLFDPPIRISLYFKFCNRNISFICIIIKLPDYLQHQTKPFQLSILPTSFLQSMSVMVKSHKQTSTSGYGKEVCNPQSSNLCQKFHMLCLERKCYTLCTNS